MYNIKIFILFIKSFILILIYGLSQFGLALEIRDELKRFFVLRLNPSFSKLANHYSMCECVRCEHIALTEDD